MQFSVCSKMSVSNSMRVIFGATENCHLLKVRKKIWGPSQVVTSSRSRAKSLASSVQGSVWESHSSLTPEHQSGTGISSIPLVRSVRFRSPKLWSTKCTWSKDALVASKIFSRPSSAFFASRKVETLRLKSPNWAVWIYIMAPQIFSEIPCYTDSENDLATRTPAKTI